MSEKFDQDLEDLIVLLRNSDVKKCRYSDGKSSLNLEFADVNNQAARAEKPASVDNHDMEIVSPSIGYATLQQSGTETPLCKVDDEITKGQTVALVSFENLFLSVKAPVSGKVIGIHVEDGQRVGYGDLIATIRP